MRIWIKIFFFRSNSIRSNFICIHILKKANDWGKSVTAKECQLLHFVLFFVCMDERKKEFQYLLSSLGWELSTNRIFPNDSFQYKIDMLHSILFSTNTKCLFCHSVNMDCLFNCVLFGVWSLPGRICPCTSICTCVDL